MTQIRYRVNTRLMLHRSQIHTTEGEVRLADGGWNCTSDLTDPLRVVRSPN
jgi:hypothetical protein